MQDTCHHCGYDLLGLPDRGRCPECGQDYDKHSVYRAIHAAEPKWFRHVKWVTLAVMTVMILMCGGAFSIGSDRPLGVVALTLVLAGVTGFGAFTYWWVQRQEQREGS